MVFVSAQLGERRGVVDVPAGRSWKKRALVAFLLKGLDDVKLQVRESLLEFSVAVLKDLGMLLDIHQLVLREYLKAPGMVDYPLK